jgi:hypothetical protein
LTNWILIGGKSWFNNVSWQEAVLARCLMSDEEWAVFRPFLTGNQAQGGRPARDHRRTLGSTLLAGHTLPILAGALLGVAGTALLAPVGRQA